MQEEIIVTDDNEEHRGVTDTWGRLEGFANLGRFKANSEVILYSVVKPIEGKEEEEEKSELYQILQEVQDKQISVHACELLLKSIFKIEKHPE